MACESARVVIPKELGPDNLTFSNVPDNDYPEWSSSKTYSEGERVIRLYRIYENVKAGKGEAPEDHPETWVDDGAINRYKVFDQKVGDQTTNLGTIEMTISELSGFVDTVALLNLDSSRVEVVLEDNIEGEVFRKEVKTIDYSASNWHQYFFKPITRKTDVIIDDIPPYSSPTVHITVEDSPGKLVKIGQVVTGSRFNIGKALWGTSVSVRDFSEKQFDEYGDVSVLVRDWSKRPEFDLDIETGRVDEVMLTLAGVRSIPCVYIGHGDFSMTIAYGYYRELMTVLSNASTSSCTLTIEALT